MDEFGRMRRLYGLVSQQGAAATAREVRLRAYSTNVFVGLKRVRGLEVHAPQARMSIAVRPLAPRDHGAFRRAAEVAATSKDRQEFLERDALLEAGLGTCYVAAAPSGELCYAQWMITPEDNRQITAHFRQRLPELDAGELLLEGAITFPKYRKLGVMAAAMAQIAQFGPPSATSVSTYVHESNSPSFKACVRAGFSPYIARVERWRRFTCAWTTEPLPLRLRS